MRWLAPITLVLSVVACDNTVQPIVDGAEGQLSLHGYLDTAADTQFVRLEALRPSISQDGVGLQDLTVTTSTNGGTSRLWHHQRTVLDDGSPGDLFYAVFSPQAGQTYTLRAETPEGDVTEAVTEVPPVPGIFPLAPVGDTLTLRQSVRVLGLEREPLRLTVLYEVREPNAAETILVDVDYGRGGGPEGQDWELDIFLKRDQGTVLVQLNRDFEDKNVALVSIGLRAEILSQEWTVPGGNTSAVGRSNITGGRGFFGAIGRYDLSWSLEASTIGVMGFRDGS